MLNNWKQHVSQYDFEILLDFVDKTQKGIQLDCKFICLVGEKNKELTQDIVNIIGENECKIIDTYPYKLVKDLTYESDEEDEDSNYDDEGVPEYSYYINKKLLVFDNDIALYKFGSYGPGVGVIKQVLGCDLMLYRTKGKLDLIECNSNIIVNVNCTKKLFDDEGIKARAIVINLN